MSLRAADGSSRKTGARSPGPETKGMAASALKEKRKHLQRRDASDTEGSEDSESQDSEQTNSHSSDQKIQPQVKHVKGRRKAPAEWEIVEGLRDGQRFETKPDVFSGFMTKKRKWPMKGWHKRYFVLENGKLTYAKSPSDIQKGKFHGTVDIGLSVIAFKRECGRIDIDADDLIYHLKVKNQVQFDEWVRRLKLHRLYRQHEFSYGTRDAPKLTEYASGVDELTPITSPVSPVASPLEKLSSLSRDHGSFKTRSNTLLERSQSRVAAWLMDTAGVDRCNKDLKDAQRKIFEMGTIVEKLSQQSSNADQALEANLAVPEARDRLHSSTSNPNLFSCEMGGNRPQSLPEQFYNLPGLSDHRMQDLKMQDEFISTAKSVHETLRSLTRSICNERDKLKHTLEQDSGASLHGNTVLLMQLRQALSEALKQNTDLRNRLGRIHAESTLSSVVSSPGATQDTEQHPLLVATASWESQSVSEFYDAAEYLISSEASSEISEDEEEVSSDISDTENATVQSNEDYQFKCQTGRRVRLPAPKPEVGDVSLWGLLCKNIGKDLSKICMPVTLNEPLSMLQRLCEELEYSELIDKAAETDDPYHRMVLVAAFTVSGYAGSHYRAGQKPFNPLLGETYECNREDKGWRFVAEQVSHHPPISACYCDSKNFMFFQDVRIKTKFWGKSMEIQPVGTVNLTLPRYKDHYKWNKVTTCVHNLLGGQRWVDHYGEVVIRNGPITCKLTYAKSSYWSEKRHEVYGSITDQDGKVVHHLFGKWNEGLYYGHAPSAKCVWRPGSMPEDHEMYYGFTRFATELNEIDPDQVHFYAPTDSRFRPDQRALEEGKVQQAENEKMRLEQQQRERRKKREDDKVTHEPKWFVKVEEEDHDVYAYTGKYWELRRDPGFLSMPFEKLW